MPPPWFFWTMFGIFCPFCPLFVWLWRRKRRDHVEFAASAMRVEGVVVDRREWETVYRASSGKERFKNVKVWVEYRDHSGAVHRTTNERGILSLEVGETTTVLYNPRAPSDARLARDRVHEFLLLFASVMFVGVTVLFLALGIVASGS